MKRDYSMIFGDFTTFLETCNLLITPGLCNRIRFLLNVGVTVIKDFRVLNLKIRSNVELSMDITGHSVVMRLVKSRVGMF